MRRELAALLRDGRRVVAHPLQLIGDMVEREQESQVTRDRALGGDRCGDHARDLALELVDHAITADDGDARGVVVRDDRGERSPDLGLDVGPHPEHVVLDLDHLAVEGRPMTMGLLSVGRSRQVCITGDLVERFGERL